LKRVDESIGVAGISAISLGVQPQVWLDEPIVFGHFRNITQTNLAMQTRRLARLPIVIAPIFGLGVLLSLGAMTRPMRQQLQSPQLQRPDGTSIPSRSYPVSRAQCRGIALLSHGAGGSETGLAYLGESLAQAGWLTIAVGHRESGPAALKSALRGNGLKDGLRNMTSDRSAYEARFRDLGAALAWAKPRCKSGFTALVGHSMGAATVILEAGAANKLGITGQNRFDAYVALSPQGPGVIFPENAWGSIAKPVLMLTGTEDESVEGSWKTRLAAYENLRPGCKWLGVIDGATHMNLAGNESATTATLASRGTVEFLAALGAGHCGKPPIAPGITYRQK
jgi:dienelactone hydrolase